MRDKDSRAKNSQQALLTNGEKSSRLKLQQASADSSLETHRSHETCFNPVQVPF